MEKFLGTSAYLEGTKVVINEEKPILCVNLPDFDEQFDDVI